MLTRDDFMFLLDERGLPVPPHPLLHLSPLDPLAPRYVVIQLIEIGGDHIDLLMAHSQGRAPPELADIAVQSARLLRTASKTMYFVNASTLFTPDCQSNRKSCAGSVFTSSPTLETLKKRMAFLNATYPPGHEVVFNLMRVPQGLTAPDAVSAFTTLITDLKAAEGWRFGVAEVRAASHLTQDGCLDAEGTVATLCRLLAMSDAGQGASADALIVPHVIAAASAAAGRWLTFSDFEEYVEGMHFAEVPAPTMLQRFAHVAHALAAKHVMVESSASPEKTTVWVEFFSGGGGGGVLNTYGGSEYAVRLPHLGCVWEAITSFALRDVPAHIWFTQDTVCGELREKLVQPIRAIEEAAAEALGRRDYTLFVGLVEDWVLCTLLASPDAPRLLEFPCKANVSESEAAQIIERITSPSSGSSRDATYTVRIKLT